MSKKWKDIVSAVAPTLATALGGPLAGMATKAISDKLLGKESASDEEITTALSSSNPEILLKLKELDTEFQKHMAAVGVDLEKIAAEDRNSARRREVESGDSMTPRVLAYSVVVLTFFLEGWILLQGLPAGVNEIVVGRILGTLDGASLMVLAYYFGSSAGSRDKDKSLSDIAKMP